MWISIPIHDRMRGAHCRQRSSPAVYVSVFRPAGNPDSPPMEMLAHAVLAGLIPLGFTYPHSLSLPRVPQFCLV